MLIPRAGGPAPDRQVDMGRCAVENLERFVTGREVRRVVRPEKYRLIT